MRTHISEVLAGQGGQDDDRDAWCDGLNVNQPVFEVARDIGLVEDAIAVVTLVNAFVGPLLRLLAAPLNCLTMGLMRFVVNALLFWIAGSVGLGLSVQGFLPALYGSIALSSISGVLDLLIPKDKD